LRGEKNGQVITSWSSLHPRRNLYLEVSASRELPLREEINPLQIYKRRGKSPLNQKRKTGAFVEGKQKKQRLLWKRDARSSLDREW